MLTITKKTWRWLLDVIRWLPGAAIIIFFILVLYNIPSTGFSDYTTPTGEFVRGKTLWDWMELLIIPIALGIGAYYLNRSERNTEREIAADRQHEAALQTYFDRMFELLLKEKLRTTKKAEVRDVARTRTVSIMRVLDTRRNNSVLQFLRETKLVTDEKSILIDAEMDEMNLQGLNLYSVYLQGANLYRANLQDVFFGGANLQGANLTEANLQGAYLYEVNLQSAYLNSANLQDANMNDANLSLASLANANLQGAYLHEVNLQGAVLEDADLRRTNLSTARNITEKQLAQVKSLKGATMPDGTIHK